MIVDEEALGNKIDELCTSRSRKWANTKAKKLIAAAAKSDNTVSKLDEEIGAQKKLKNIR